MLVLGGGTLLAAQVQGDLEAGVHDLAAPEGFQPPAGDKPPLKLNEFKLPSDITLDIPEGAIVSPDLSKLTLPEDMDLQLPDDLDLSNLDFELPQDFDLQLPEGSTFSPGGLDLPNGGSIKLPDGRSFDLPPGSHLDIPPALAEKLRQAGVPSGIPLSSDMTAPIRGLPEGTNARLDPPQFSGPGDLRLPAGTTITLPNGQRFPFPAGALAAGLQYLLPAGTTFDLPFDAGGAGGTFPVPQPRSPSQLPGRSGTGTGPGGAATGIAVTTEINDMPQRVRKGEPVVVGGYVYELATGRPVAGAPVDVFMNESKRLPGVLVGQGSTGANGLFRITLDLPEDKPAASYQLVNHASAFVDATGRAFADGWGDPPFATYASTRLTLSVPARDGAGSRVPITGTLLDHTGAPVPGTPVTIAVNGAPAATATTIASGAFSTTYTFASAGTHRVTASFAGNANYDASTAGPSNITITNYVMEVASAVRARPGEDVTLSGRLLDQGTALPGREVRILGVPFGASTRAATTDSGGRFSLTLTVPVDQRAGSSTLRYQVAEFEVDKPQLFEINESGRFVLSAPTTWDVELPMDVELSLKTNGTPARALAGQTVRLTLSGPGGTNETTVLTGADGSAATTMRALRDAPGTYTLSARVVGPPNLQVGSVTTTVALGAFEVAWEAPTTLARGESAAIGGVVRFMGRPFADQTVDLGVLAPAQPVTTDASGRFTLSATIPRGTEVGPANLTLAAIDHPTRTFPVAIVSAAKIELDAPQEFEAGARPEMGLRLVDDLGAPIRDSLVTLTAVGPGGTQRTVVKTDGEGRWHGPVNVTANAGDNVTMSARFDAAGPYFAADTTSIMSATAPVVKGPMSPLLWIVPLAVLGVAGAGGATWYFLRKRASTRSAPVVAATPIAAAPVMRAADFDVTFGIPADEPAVWGIGEPLELTVRNRGAAGEIELAWPGGSRRVTLGPDAVARTTLTFPQEGDVAITARRASATDIAPVSATVRIVDYPKETAREFDLFLDKAQNLDARIGKRSTPREIQWTLAEHLGGDAEQKLEEIALVMEVTNYSNDASKRTRSHYLRFLRASRALDPFFVPRAVATLPAPPPPPPRG